MAGIDTTSPPNFPVLDDETLRKMDRYWRACNYLAAGMIYLRANPLLREPLKAEHIKRRLLGHWGSDPGQSWCRFSLAIDVIDRVPALRGVGDHVKEWLRGQIIEHVAYAHAEGIDCEAIRNWTWKG